ncbi:enterochelin esterase domain-containing protein [Agromyces archimandritae]|uniref:DUF3327 domain-containing protein n=1 Tax=Agromyces archimandritae TaxID=2781962 RepID=A0A975FKU2_9MICO|nr:enterochelin esterase domain-containing protein [Agromyces archimandritae]QTX03809.1 DUF3327 domain-containing protein [Agromyces archimandritae]
MHPASTPEPAQAPTGGPDPSRGIVRVPNPPIAEAGPPRIGERVVRGGRAYRAVTFSWADADPRARVLLHVNGLTDQHRADVTPALLERVAPGVLAATVLIDERAAASYRFASDPELPVDAGRTRDGWRRVHRLGVPDPHGAERIPNPLGDASSVLTMPAAPVHPAWAAGAPVRTPGTLRTLVAHDPEHGPRSIRVWMPEGARPGRLLVLFDGETWHGLGIADALVRREGPPFAVALVDAISLDVRARQLPDPVAAAALLETQVLPALAGAGIRYAAEHTVVSGESFGGLAAAGIAITRPDLAGTAIARSGSFHFRADAADPGGRPGAAGEPGTGDLAARLDRHPPAARLMLSAGDWEPVIAPHARRFAELAAARGFDAAFTPYAGGHDYAWWRHELFRSLDALR